MREVPKATPNNNPFHENDTAVDFVKPKSSVIHEAGFTPKQAERFQQLASHPEIVEQAKAEARENDDIVLREGEALKRPIRITLYVWTLGYTLKLLKMRLLCWRLFHGRLWIVAIFMKYVYRAKK